MWDLEHKYAQQMPAMSLITVPKYRLSDSDCRRPVKACQVMFYASRDGKKNAMGMTVKRNTSMGNAGHWRLRYEAVKTERIMRVKSHDISKPFRMTQNSLHFGSSSVDPRLWHDLT